MLHIVYRAALVVWVVATITSVMSSMTAIKDLSGLAALLSAIVFGLAHGGIRFGGRGMIAMFAIAVVVANIYENLSIMTGFPFGYYYHTPLMGPKLFNVPLQVGVGYFAACYLSFALADALLGRSPRRSDRLWRHGIPVIAAFFATAWDMSVDPLGATVAQRWIYPGGGAFFGVPLSNFAGWYLVTWTIFELTTFALTRPFATTKAVRPEHWYAACAFWALYALQYLLIWSQIGDGVVIDRTGWRWRIGDIAQTSVLTAMLTLMAVAVLTALVVRSRSTEGAPD